MSDNILRHFRGISHISLFAVKTIEDLWYIKNKLLALSGPTKQLQSMKAYAK